MTEITQLGISEYKPPMRPYPIEAKELHQPREQMSDATIQLGIKLTSFREKGIIEPREKPQKGSWLFGT